MTFISYDAKPIDNRSKKNSKILKNTSTKNFGLKYCSDVTTFLHFIPNKESTYHY